MKTKLSYTLWGLSLVGLALAFGGSPAESLLDGLFTRADNRIAPEVLSTWRNRSWTNCDGFLTRNAPFCESNPPADWTRHSYNGEVYYFQPLKSGVISPKEH